MNVPWRHHSVPQLLLRSFVDAGGLLWHFDKRHPERGIGHDGPRRIFYQRHQYSTIDYDTDQLDPSLEYFFDRDVESPAAPVIQKIINAARNRKAPRLSPPERSQLDLFMQFQARRVPELVEKYRTKGDRALTAVIADLEREHGPLPDWFGDPTEVAKLSRNAIVDAQGSPHPKLTAFQRTRGLLIAAIVDRKKAFIIGSNPVIPFPPPGFPEFGVHGYWLPLASDVAVSLGGPAGTEHLRPIRDHASIRRFNELAFEQSNAIAARSRELIASLIDRR